MFHTTWQKFIATNLISFLSHSPNYSFIHSFIAILWNFNWWCHFNSCSFSLSLPFFLHHLHPRVSWRSSENWKLLIFFVVVAALNAFTTPPYFSHGCCWWCRWEKLRERWSNLLRSQCFISDLTMMLVWAFDGGGNEQWNLTLNSVSRLLIERWLDSSSFELMLRDARVSTTCNKIYCTEELLFSFFLLKHKMLLHNFFDSLLLSDAFRFFSALRNSTACPIEFSESEKERWREKWNVKIIKSSSKQQRE